MLPNLFAGRPQELPIAARASIGQLRLGGGLRRLCVEQTEPSGGLRTVCSEQPRVRGTGSILQEEPATVDFRVLEETVVAERRQAQARKNLLVDRALDEGVCPLGPLGDHRGAGRPRAL